MPKFVFGLLLAAGLVALIVLATATALGHVASPPRLRRRSPR
jgi:hypothetical protein